MSTSNVDGPLGSDGFSKRENPRATFVTTRNRSAPKRESSYDEIGRI
jgi:hypothetical protein